MNGDASRLQSCGNRTSHAPTGLTERAFTGDTSTPRILVVGRSEGNASVVGATLESLQVTFIVASDQHGAREHMANLDFDLILVLHPLPASDVADKCLALRRADARVPLVVLADAGGPEDVIAGIDAGADAYLVEPIHPEELRARLAAFLRRYRRTPQRAGAIDAAYVGEHRRPPLSSDTATVARFSEVEHDGRLRQACAVFDVITVSHIWRRGTARGGAMVGGPH